MDILDQAIEFEYQGLAFFKKSAEKAENPAVKEIFMNLAKDEQQHAAFLETLKKGSTLEYKASESMKNIKGIIKEACIKDDHFLSKEAGILDTLKAALDFEDRTRNHFLEESMKTADANLKHLLTMLAKEEEMHHKLIENLIKFYETPQDILETQEFQSYGS